MEMTQESANQIKYSDVEKFRAITHPDTISGIDFEALRKKNQAIQEEEKLKRITEEISLGKYNANLVISSRQELPSGGGGFSLNEMFPGMQMGMNPPERQQQYSNSAQPAVPGVTALPLLVSFF
jgi:signal recognition particle GTPase